MICEIAKAHPKNEIGEKRPEFLEIV